MVLFCCVWFKQICVFVYHGVSPTRLILEFIDKMEKQFLRRQNAGTDAAATVAVEIDLVQVVTPRVVEEVKVVLPVNKVKLLAAVLQQQQ